MEKIITPVMAIVTAIIGVAIISVLVSNKANTTSVIQALASAFNTILQTAMSPVTNSTGTNSTVGIASQVTNLAMPVLQNYGTGVPNSFSGSSM